MTYFHVLVEGKSDEPVVQEILQRRFQLTVNDHFRIYPHRGKGSLPAHPNQKPEPKWQGLLDLLPAKLRAWASLPEGNVVVVLVDADRENGVELKAQLRSMYDRLEKKPPQVLFRLAVEETESWLIADLKALRTAYPKAKLQKLTAIAPDAIVGAWERLAESLGRKPHDCNGADKLEWAKNIMPHVDLDAPKSPSLHTFVKGIARFLPATHEGLATP